MKLLTDVAGFLCWMLATFMGLGLIASAVDDSISAAQAIVMLAVCVGAGWAGYWLLGHNSGHPASLD